MGVIALADSLKQGFLGTEAPLYADIVLVVEVAMGVALLAGAFLARARKYRAHACCQSFIVLLNLVVVLLVMVPAFRERIAPKIPAKLGTTSYLLATAHAALGTITEIAALYILLAAGTKLLPERLRLVRYKVWMRTLLVLWWVVLILGGATYARWYIR